MLTDPRPRPREHLSDVTVVDHRERRARTEPKELGIARIAQLTSHNLYIAYRDEV